MNLTLIDKPAIAARQPLPQLALLARLLADVMLAGVQNAASLNLSAARALLVHARIPVPAALERQHERWRWTWRNFEICATSADQVLELARGHVDRSTAGLWRAVERLFGDLAQVQSTQLDSLRESFETLRVAQAAYWQAAQQAHGELVALARSEEGGRG